MIKSFDRVRGDSRFQFQRSLSASNQLVLDLPLNSLTSKPPCASKRSDTIDFTTVYSNQEVTELFSLALLYPKDNILADDALNCVPLLVDGSRKWLGYSNVSYGIIVKFVKVIRKHRCRSDFCVKALKTILELCADKKVTHDPNVQRFSDVSTIKIITLVLNDHLVTNVAKKQRYCVLLRLMSKRWHSLNIDDNVQNIIFSYLYSQKQNDLVVELCCQVINVFATSGLSKVMRKIVSTSGCCESLIDVLKSTTSPSISLMALNTINRTGVKCIESKLIAGGFVGVLMPLLKVYKEDSRIADTGLSIIKKLLDLCVRPSIEHKLLFVKSCISILSSGGCEIIMDLCYIHMQDHSLSMTAWEIVHKMTTASNDLKEYSPSYPRDEIRQAYECAGVENILRELKKYYPNDEPMNKLLVNLTLPDTDSDLSA